MPNAKVIEEVLSALENGVPAEVAAIMGVVGATEAEVRDALAAVQRYRQRVRDARSNDERDAAGDDARLPAGTRLGDFVIEGVLGSGAMGVVYRARQVALDRPVALKVLQNDLVGRDARFAARFRREANLAAAVHPHPHLAEVFGFVQEGDTLAFAMRLVEGPTLHEVLQCLANEQVAPVRPTSPEHVRQSVLLVRALADAIAVLHSAGLVHRDVKPGNVLLEGGSTANLSGTPVLVDFGLLRPTDDMSITGTHTVLGTPAYASHESVLRQGVDARADVFSLGATLHDLLTVTSPGTRGAATAGLPDVRSINPRVDARLAAIVAMAVQPDKLLRYEHGGAFRDELDRYLRGEAIRALPARAWGRLLLWVRRDRARAARVGALAAMAAILIVGLSLVAAWATNLSRDAAAAARHEAEGDLVNAAARYRELLDSPGAGALWWLAEGLQRAALYSHADGPLRVATEHLTQAMAVLEQGSRPSLSEQAFERANDRLCEALFGAHATQIQAAVFACLRREMDAAPEFRQRAALDTWTNYLIVQRGRQDYPLGLLDVLEQRVLRDWPDLEQETWEAAIAAYGAIRSHRTLSGLVELMNRDLPRDAATLATAASYHVYEWLFLADREKAFPESESVVSLLEQWAQGVDRQAERHDPAMRNALAQRLAYWERNPETPHDPPRRLEVSDKMRHELDQWSAAHHRTWASNSDRILGDATGDESHPLSSYFRASGRAAYEFDDAIWKHRSGEDTEVPLSPDRSDSGSARCALELVKGDEQGPEVRFLGTVFEAGYRAGTLKNWESGDAGYLRFDRPGHSALRVRSRVPPTANTLQIRVDHMVSGRSVVRDFGTVAVRVSVTGLPWQVSSIAPNNRLHDRATPQHNSHTIADVPLYLFGALDDIEVVVEYVHGNTTYRVRGVELVWGFPKPK